MKIFNFIFTLFFIMACSVNVSAHVPPKLIREFKKVVKVIAVSKDETGMVIATGFPINPSEIMTAGHFCASVVDGVKSGVIKEQMSIQFLNNNDEIELKLVKEILKVEFSSTQDLCIISVPKHGLVPVKISLEKVKFGDLIYASGVPQGEFPIITEGYVSQPINEGDGPDDLTDGKMLLSISAAVGSSGSPVFNIKGEVIGVIVLVNSKYDQISYAVTGLNIWRFILE